MLAYFFLRNEINFTVHEDLSTFIEGEFEAVFAEIISGDKKKRDLGGNIWGAEYKSSPICRKI